MKFIETKQPRLLEDGGCREADRVALRGFSARNHLAKGRHALMHVGHELMKMCATLMRDGARFEEQVHQHGLAAANGAMDIQATRRHLFVCEQAAEKPTFAAWIVAVKACFQSG